MAQGMQGQCRARPLGDDGVGTRRDPYDVTGVGTRRDPYGLFVPQDLEGADAGYASGDEGGGDDGEKDGTGDENDYE